MSLILELTRGIVVQTDTTSLLGPLFYSDRTYEMFENSLTGEREEAHPLLNQLSRVSVLGRGAGIIRMVLAVIHSVGHLIAALITFNKGHCFHAAKGGCEFLRGLIESIPFLGYNFADEYCTDGLWWMIKIYNPERPDGLDIAQGKWVHFKEARGPGAYIIA